jgi:hypothetical protein
MLIWLFVMEDSDDEINSWKLMEEMVPARLLALQRYLKEVI